MAEHSEKWEWCLEGVVFEKRRLCHLQKSSLFPCVEYFDQNTAFNYLKYAVYSCCKISNIHDFKKIWIFSKYYYNKFQADLTISDAQNENHHIGYIP
jgi:hypothetical protein